MLGSAEWAAHVKATRLQGTSAEGTHEKWWRQRLMPKIQKLKPHSVQSYLRRIGTPLHAHKPRMTLSGTYSISGMLLLGKGHKGDEKDGTVLRG